MSVSEAVILISGSIGAFLTVCGVLAWLITPRLIDVVERTVNGKIDMLLAMVSENATKADARHEEQIAHQREMHGHLLVSKERHAQLTATLAAHQARIDAMQADRR